MPLTETTQTMGRLLGIEVLVFALVLVGLAVAAWLLIKRDLRPLEAMADTAGAIAAGDLSQRVEPAEPRTEVGRLGLSLNAMLEQIEVAFAERAATEEKLRRFLADASHELRTPLTSIRGYAEVFERGAKDDPEDLATAMRRIEEESRRMGVMVDELLLLARLGEGREPEREPVDLARVVADAVGDARAADAGRDISLDAPAELVVTGDEHQLRQVVANLLGNARKHTPPDCPVHVRLRSEDGDAGEAGEAVLEVADEGPGLTPEVAAKVFEPFYRADKSRARQSGGAGLGLAIVAAIVEAHGGSVALRTQPGEGATFSVRLPLSSSQLGERAHHHVDQPVGRPRERVGGGDAELELVEGDRRADLGVGHVLVVDGEADDLRVGEGLDEVDLAGGRRHRHVGEVAQHPRRAGACCRMTASGRLPRRMKVDVR